MKVDYDLYYKDSGSVNKGHYVESNESVSISLSHDYTTHWHSWEMLQMRYESKDTLQCILKHFKCVENAFQRKIH